MAPYTPDPLNPRGRRTGSLPGSGTHDEQTAAAGGGAIEDVAQPVAQAAGDGATELLAWIASHEQETRGS